MSPTLPLLLLTFADVEARPAIVRVHDLAALTSFQAERLRGRRALYRVRLDSADGEHAGFVLYDCGAPAGVLGSVWLYPGQQEEIAGEMVVEA
jgi:hypothetical protein